MNCIAEGPILQIITRLAEILQRLAVEKLHLAACAHGRNKPGDIVDDLEPVDLPRSQEFLCPLPVLDINVCSVPLDYVA